MKKRYYIIIAIILFIGVNTYLVYDTINNKENKYQTLEENPSNLRILVDNVEVASIPAQNSGYIFDSATCSNNNISISFDYINWKVNINTAKTNKCTLKFKRGSLSDIEKRLLNNGTNVAYDDFGNLRYIGASPKNYIWYNCNSYAGLTTANAQDEEHACEKWRIIGLMKNIETKSKGNQDLIKIIRDEPLPMNLVWDNNFKSDKGPTNGGTNIWDEARLMLLLNEGHETTSGYNGSLYWNREYGRCPGKKDATGTVPDYNGLDYSYEWCDFRNVGLYDNETKTMIESVKWNLGGIGYSSGLDGYYNALAITFYGKERGLETYSSDGHTRPTEWTGKIALMYPSDYAYATGGGNTYNRQQCLNTFLYDWRKTDIKTDCAGNNWLYIAGTTQWTLMPMSSAWSSAFTVSSTGHIITDYTDYAEAVRPTLYLTSTTKISTTVGDGSADNPYILVP